MAEQAKRLCALFATFALILVGGVFIPRGQQASAADQDINAPEGSNVCESYNPKFGPGYTPEGRELGSTLFVDFHMPPEGTTQDVSSGNTVAYQVDWALDEPAQAGDYFQLQLPTDVFDTVQTQSNGVVDLVDRRAYQQSGSVNVVGCAWQDTNGLMTVTFLPSSEDFNKPYGSVFFSAAVKYAASGTKPSTKDVPIKLPNGKSTTVKVGMNPNQGVGEGFRKEGWFFDARYADAETGKSLNSVLTDPDATAEEKAAAIKHYKSRAAEWRLVTPNSGNTELHNSVITDDTSADKEGDWRINCSDVNAQLERNNFIYINGYNPNTTDVDSTSMAGTSKLDDATMNKVLNGISINCTSEKLTINIKWIPKYTKISFKPLRGEVVRPLNQDTKLTNQASFKADEYAEVYASKTIDYRASGFVKDLVNEGSPSILLVKGVTKAGAKLPELQTSKDSAHGEDKSPVTKLTRGDKVTYFFDITNTGDITLSDVALEDEFLESKGIKVTLKDTELKPGETVRATSSEYTITEADVKAGFVKNTATVTAPDPRPAGDKPRADLTDDDPATVTTTTVPSKKNVPTEPTTKPAEPTTTPTEPTTTPTEPTAPTTEPAAPSQEPTTPTPTQQPVGPAHTTPVTPSAPSRPQVTRALPRTGTEVAGLVGAAALLVAGGLALFAARRKLNK